jgi:hypothetical protein
MLTLVYRSRLSFDDLKKVVKRRVSGSIDRRHSWNGFASPGYAPIMLCPSHRLLTVSGSPADTVATSITTVELPATPGDEAWLSIETIATPTSSPETLAGSLPASATAHTLFVLDTPPELSTSIPMSCTNEFVGACFAQLAASETHVTLAASYTFYAELPSLSELPSIPSVTSMEEDERIAAARRREARREWASISAARWAELETAREDGEAARTKKVQADGAKAGEMRHPMAEVAPAALSKLLRSHAVRVSRWRKAGIRSAPCSPFRSPILC